MGSIRKQEDQAVKGDEMNSHERVNMDYVMNLFKITMIVPSEVLKVC